MALNRSRAHKLAIRAVNAATGGTSTYSEDSRSFNRLSSSEQNAIRIKEEATKALVDAILDIVTGSNNTGLNNGDFTGQVTVEIPSTAVVVAVTGGSGNPAVGVPNPVPIRCTGNLQKPVGKGVGN